MANRRKLKSYQAKEIREKYFRKNYTQMSLASEYNVSQNTIWHIITNKVYKEVV